MKQRVSLMALPLALALAVPAAQAAERRGNAAAQQLAAATRGQAQIAYHGATGVARFVRLPGGAPGTLAPLAARTGSPQDQSQAFLAQYAGLFGMRSPATELRFVGSTTDVLGGSHLTYLQTYAGIPVFAGTLRTHFDKSGQLRSVNGTFIPNIAVPTRAARTPEQAAAAALKQVNEQKHPTTILAAMSNRLLVFRENLARGIPGPSHLAYEVVVGNGMDVREFVYVDAMTAKPIDQITGIQDAAVNRRSYDGHNWATQSTYPDWPASPIWVEGDPFPTTFTCTAAPAPYNCNTEADHMLYASAETWSMFFNGFARDSYNNAGAVYDSIFDRGWGCVNASWNGSYISFCPGTTSDDVTAHELGHAYTTYTHNLIYAWQPGALNESYSDIWGETLDQINGRQTDTPNNPRTEGTCSGYELFPAITRVNSPGNIAADYTSGTSAFSPYITTLNMVTADVIQPDDGYNTAGTLTDGCCAGPTYSCAAGSWTNAASIAGKIVLVDRGLCGFQVKAQNAQRHGAIGVIIANVASSGSPSVAPNMAGAAGYDTITVPTVSMNYANGELLRTELGVPNTVNATLRPNNPAVTDDSVRWLMGEDAAAFGGPAGYSAIRDMFTPTCFANPGKVSDTAYYCGSADGGGVHYNSGVPNHAYALIVDGGTYNSQTITGIGLHKAGHIYYRAQTVYQVEDTDFAAHADAIEQSCTDLVGQALPELSTGAPTGNTVTITAGDCAEVAKAMLAVEMRTPPTQCGFLPLLEQNPPSFCGAGTTPIQVFSEGFENGSTGWTVSHVAPEITTDWVLDSTLPKHRSGSAFFAADPNAGTCAPGGDITTAMYLTSPTITLPAWAGDPVLTFEHYVATETGWDGGNLKLQVNGGGFQSTVWTDYLFNGYNYILGAGGGLGGEQAFSGTDQGSVSGTWGESQFALSSFANAGDSVQLQFAFGADGCGGRDGWYVDDVKIFTCGPALSIDSVSGYEGNYRATPFQFTVTLSVASAGQVTVKYATSNGSARVPSDYLGTTGTLTFAPGETSKTINVNVIGDRIREAAEVFYVKLSSPVGATIAVGTGRGVILNDD